MIYDLKDILRLLDRFIGHYPIYLYLVDTQHTIVWFNRYMAANLPDLEVGKTLNTDLGLWPGEEDLEGVSPGVEEQSDVQVKKNIIKTRINSTDDQERSIEFFNLPVLSKNGQPEGVFYIGMDVTENENLQKQLREKEKLFTAIIDSSTDAVIFLDNEDRVMNWNNGAEEVFGYSAEEIIGHSVVKLIPEELIQLGELNYIHKELSQKGFLKKYETQRRHKDGHLIYVDISSTRIYNDQGILVGTSEIIKDIDSRKELEFELLRTILELSKLNELNEMLHRTYEEEEILRIILIAITAGEGLRFNRAFIMMVDKKDGKLKGNLAIGPSDEEEANRIWSELNQNYRYLRDIINIYKIDLEGSDKKVNEIVNRIEVPLNRTDHILIHALNNKRVFHIKNGRFPDGNSYAIDIEDISLFELLKNDTCVVAPIYSKKEPLGIIIADNCINRREISTEDVESLMLFANQASSAIENARLYQTLEDRIQDIQNAYQQLEENQEKLLRAERLATIGEMSAKIAHEIRNPLVSIGGFARLIEKRIPEEPAIKKYAGIIREQVDNLENILDNILSVANPRKPQRQLLNINRTLHRVTQVFRNAIEQRGIEFIVNLEDINDAIFGDEKLLYQAFLNLLKNAIEALEGQTEGGTIEVMSAVRDGDIEVQISDNGPGIDTTLLSKIFQTFFTTKSRGTGLGLSIVHQIVEDHHGKIEVKSKAKEGTTFYLRFPIVPERQLVEG